MVHPEKTKQGREEYLDYLDAWHQDRLHWLETIRKAVSFANAGGAVAVAAFIRTAEAGRGPKVSLLLFVVGFLIPIGANFSQLNEAENQIKLIKSEKQDFTLPGTATKKGLEKPPTRRQMRVSKWLSVIAFGFLIVGLVFAISAIETPRSRLDF